MKTMNKVPFLDMEPRLELSVLALAAILEIVCIIIDNTKK